MMAWMPSAGSFGGGCGVAGRQDRSLFPVVRGENDAPEVAGILQLDSAMAHFGLGPDHARPCRAIGSERRDPELHAGLQRVLQPQPGAFAVYIDGLGLDLHHRILLLEGNDQRQADQYPPGAALGSCGHWRLLGRSHLGARVGCRGCLCTISRSLNTNDSFFRTGFLRPGRPEVYSAMENRCRGSWCSVWRAGGVRATPNWELRGTQEHWWAPRASAASSKHEAGVPRGAAENLAASSRGSAAAARFIFPFLRQVT
jgi:hypothetical protein